LDDLGRKETLLAACHYNNNNANDYHNENFRENESISNSNICDTDDDLDDLPSSFAEETDQNTNSFLIHENFRENDFTKKYI
jgi:hypothetical protein